MEGKLIKRGAEAEIYLVDYHGWPAVRKLRLKRTYRDPELDIILRKTRTRKEAVLIKRARDAGLMTPMIYDIDLVDMAITMEYIDGTRVKEFLNTMDSRDERVDLCARIGAYIARLHNSGITHGDLTTSNIILRDGDVYFIDFSLGEKDIRVEDMAVDIHSFREAFISTHPGMDMEWKALMEAYLDELNVPEEFRKAIEVVEKRGRYRVPG